MRTQDVLTRVKWFGVKTNKTSLKLHNSDHVLFEESLKFIMGFFKFEKAVCLQS